MRLLIIAAFLACLAPPVIADEHLKLLIMNATPYEMISVDMWYGSRPPGPERTPFRSDVGFEDSSFAIGAIRSHALHPVFVSVSHKTCFVHLVAATRHNGIFSKDLDVCSEDAFWMIDSTKPL